MGIRTIQQIITFAIVGGIATIIDFLFFNLVFWMTTLFIFSRIIGILISMVWNFLANRQITFKATEEDPKKQLFKYIIVYGIAMGANIFIGWIAFQILGPGQLNANIAAALGLIVSIPTTFFGLKLWAFKKKGKETDVFPNNRREKKRNRNI